MASGKGRVGTNYFFSDNTKIAKKEKRESRNRFESFFLEAFVVPPKRW